MDFESLLKILQEWTNRVPLVILGSGASVPFGLPTMGALGEHLKNNLSLSDSDDEKQLEVFKTTLDKVGDLEAALLELQLRPKVLEGIIKETWMLINKHDLQAYEQIIEGGVFPLAELTKYLLTPAQRKLSIITTNYDRLSEYAASIANSFVCTGYSQNFVGEFSNKIHTNNLATLKGYRGQVNIWKVHGSLDWFKTKDEQDVQLPLRHSIPNEHRPSIITPGLSKYLETQFEPFRTIFTEADNEIENAVSYLCIGYGFNDVHVQPKLIAQIKNAKPIIVLAKELTAKTKEAIIGNSCKNYILIEEASTNDTRIYSSNFTGEQIVTGVNYWELSEYLKLIKST